MATKSIALVGVVTFAACVTAYSWFCGVACEPIKVGIVHSLTGTMALSEIPIVDAYRLAIEEINASGGLLDGRPVQYVVRDGQSDERIFAREAEALIVEDKVCTVFGCWTSSSYRAVKPIVEKHDHLLFYPVESEGLVEPGNVVYTGSVPNQQLIPAVTWLYNQGKRKFFLIGSDYVFPRCANAIMVEQIKALGADVVGEEYIPLGSRNIQPAIERILEARPDVMINTINGDSTFPFCKALRAAGITSDKVPTMLTSIGENELNAKSMRFVQRMIERGEVAAADSLPDLGDVVGDYAAWSYYQSLPGSANAGFVRRFKNRYGEDRVTDDPIQSGYVALHLWAQAVRDADSDRVRDIRKAIKRQSWNAPEGVVYVDPETLHTWKHARIGRIEADGQFRVVWDSETPIRPVPYPLSRTKAQWNGLVDVLYRGWGGRWGEGEE